MICYHEFQGARERLREVCAAMDEQISRTLLYVWSKKPASKIVTPKLRPRLVRGTHFNDAAGNRIRDALHLMAGHFNGTISVPQKTVPVALRDGQIPRDGAMAWIAVLAAVGLDKAGRLKGERNAVGRPDGSRAKTHPRRPARAHLRSPHELLEDIRRAR